MSQDNNYTIARKRQKVVKIDHFHWFSDIFDIDSGLNKHSDMIPTKFCQAFSGTNLEYQQGVVWV